MKQRRSADAVSAELSKKALHEKINPLARSVEQRFAGLSHIVQDCKDEILS